MQSGKMKNRLIGLVGYKKSEILKFENKFKKFEFINITDNNFFSKKTLKIDALIILFEYPVKKFLSVFLSKKFLLFKNLKWFHLSRAGVDECLPFMKKYKFKFTSGKKIQGPNVSEHCIALLLLLTRSIFAMDQSKNYSRPTEILNKKILITGLGGIGLEIAKKLSAFGGKIYSVNDSKINKKFIKKNYKLKEVKNIIKNFDIVINALPLTSVTKNFFNMKIFNEMKKNSYFINISRDQTINIRDFNIVIKKKKFAGIGIDNTGSFKMKKKIYFNPKMNFILTDHQAGVSTNLSRRKELINNNIYNYYYGKKLNFIVSKDKEY